METHRLSVEAVQTAYDSMTSGIAAYRAIVAQFVDRALAPVAERFGYLEPQDTTIGQLPRAQLKFHRQAPGRSYITVETVQIDFGYNDEKHAMDAEVSFLYNDKRLREVKLDLSDPEKAFEEALEEFEQASRDQIPA